MKETTWETLCQEAASGRAVRSHSGLVQKGDIFVALLGSRVDGSRFVADADKNGAAFVLTSDRSVETKQARRVLVADPTAALGELAALYFQGKSRQPEIIAITGTNGKTTTSFLLERLLTANAHSCGLIGTVACRFKGYSEDAAMTTPDCLTLHGLLAKMADTGTKYVSMEVSSHALDQNRLAGLTPKVAVFTNLTQDHLDYHGDMERYFAAKLRLFQTENILRVVNVDDPYGKRIAEQFPCLGFTFAASGEQKNTLYGRIARLDTGGLELECRFEGQKWTVRSPLVGAFNAANLLAVQGAGLALGLKPQELSVFDDFFGVPGRLQRVAGTPLHVFVDYAHTPDALENVCSTLKNLNYRRLFVLFGCGGNRDKGKRPLMAAAVSKYADRIFITSDNPRNEDKNAIIADILPGLGVFSAFVSEVDRKKAIFQALAELGSDDVLLIAGKGHEDYQIIGETKYPFHDASVVQEWCKVQEKKS